MKKSLVHLFVITLTMINVAFSDNWPHWRGPTYNGISEEKDLPVDWSEQKNIIWKQELPGASSATPVIWEDKIFLLAQELEQVSLLCINIYWHDIFFLNFSFLFRHFYNL